MFLEISTGYIFNGNDKAQFKILDGLRQGCPLSPLLYAICTGPLIKKITMSKHLNGIDTRGFNLRIRMYADDVVLFVKDGNDFQILMSIFKLFEEAANQSINLQKSFILQMNTKINQDLFEEIDRAVGIKYLGVYLSTDEVDNWKDLIIKLKNRINMWKKYNISILGRVKIAKTCLLSLFWYRAQFIMPKENVIKEINKNVWSYIFGKATTSRIRFKIMKSNTENGGLKMLDLEYKMRSYLCYWYARRNENHLWCGILKAKENAKSKLVQDIYNSWKLLKIINMEGKENIISLGNKYIKCDKANTKIFYNNMGHYYTEEVKPKSGQELRCIKEDFKWLDNQKYLDNKIKETAWKLIHRKLYSSFEDGGIQFIFKSRFAEQVWDGVKKIWSRWYNLPLDVNPNHLFPGRDASTHCPNEANLMKVITIRELYRSQCNEVLNNIPTNLMNSLNTTRRNLIVALDVIVHKGKKVKQFMLQHKWIKQRRNKLIVRRKKIKDDFTRL